MATYKYIPSDVRKQNRISVRIDGKWRGIGGNIDYKPRPPELPFVVREANEAEYKKAFELGISGIEKVKQENRSSRDHVQTPEPDPEGSTRSEEDQQVL